ncbi:MAG: DUF4416 family protein [archaeon]
MANPTISQKGVLICGIMYSDEKLREAAILDLKSEFGEIKSLSKEIEFNFTDYYKEEMGENIKKLFISFNENIDISCLPKIKLITNKIEKKLSAQGKRQVNLDPGYITEHQLIVASTKSRPHRIYLGKGIYAHIMFFFKKKEVETFKWTFEDYKNKDLLDFFIGIRKELIKKEKE